MNLRFALKKLYVFYCYLYSQFFSIFNFIIFKDKKIFIEKKTYLKFYKKNDIKKLIKDLKLEKKEEKYQTISIIEKDSLIKLCNFIFTSNFKNFLLRETGYRYSIDYLFIYKNKYLTKKLSKKSVYANKPHYDKPFSRNMLKLIIPIGLSTKENGALMILNNKSNLTKKDFKERYIPFLSPEEGTYIYGFNPRETSHFAQPPEEKLSGMNIMFQLNPANKWLINKKIIERQFKIEPNFPELRNFFYTNTHLKLSNANIKNV